MLLATPLWCAGLLATPAFGQEVMPSGTAQIRTRIERPPEGSMRRGSLSVPALAVWILGGVLVAGAAGILGWRLVPWNRDS